ncbi:2-hydroxyacid dehydrogenase [Poritiphilus flavus]|uniref:2-hydroxyacid dehydrogenase n=1 Tax=Poritiphilus flavus TaxID=2697053 RepID=A0A6L9EB16_9FLAO|nr:2-hydroxyacid dehydrogenase [Poritiphilus flavus]NAS11936.1 2-hydroxyacid dehydrogenase [Poritiphilus flavus]
MKLLVYSAKDFEIPYLEEANQGRHQLSFTSVSLDSHTAMQAVGFRAISIFSGDDASMLVLQKLWDFGVRYISIRSSGYNNIHIKAAKRFGFKVANAPDYSPHAIAEHTMALLLSLNRKIIQADKRIRSGNFLLDGLDGFNLHNKTVGIIGTGNIGRVMAKIFHGFGCKILANDLNPDSSLTELCQVRYTDLETLLRSSDIVSLHIPLTYENYYFINKARLGMMKSSSILLNTARGAVVDTRALIEALINRGIGGYAADVYEHERRLFFKDHSTKGISDELFKKLIDLPNVLITPHQAFVTHEALKRISEITLGNISSWENDEVCSNELGFETLIS